MNAFFITMKKLSGKTEIYATQLLGKKSFTGGYKISGKIWEVFATSLNLKYEIDFPQSLRLS